MDDSIREDLSHVPFEELLKIREKVGTKVYRHTVLNQLKPKTNKNETNSSDEGDDDDEDEDDNDNFDEKEELMMMERKGGNKSKKAISQKNFKRENRSQPIETSSKKLDSRFNFQRIQPSDELNRLKKAQTFRDPRFDPNCGQFRPDKFKQNYNFLSNLKQTELEQLKKKLKKAKNDQVKNKLIFLIKRLSNQIKADEEEKRIHEIERKVRQTKIIPTQPTIMTTADDDNNNNNNDNDNEVNNNKKFKKIKFVNKGLLKRTKLVEKYKQLKQSGQLEKYLAKKRKKLAIKDRKKLFNQTLIRNKD